MKKIIYISLAVIVLCGVGAGFWLLRSDSNQTVESNEAADSSINVSDLSLARAIEKLNSTQHLEKFLTTLPAMTQLDTATYAIIFAPNQLAVDTFTKDTALGLERFLPYHIVVSDTPVEVIEGARLKTLDGQELLIVKTDGDLYVRDAKGIDSKIKRPVEAKNGSLYLIDKVLLTQ